MKRILITGANSFIGTSFENYLKQWPEKYKVETIDMLDVSWKDKDFSQYDTVYHVAGIAHSDSDNKNGEKENLYRSINTDLTLATAKRVEEEGVKQFIFMSSAIIYGDSAPIGKKKVITKDTKPSPTNYYADSKLQAEYGLQQLSNENFKVVIIRSPMIYGEGCKGNYPLLARFAKKLSIFPFVENERSMLYIGNLVEFVRLMIDNEEAGIFWPQNKEYSNTSQMVKMISEIYGRKIIMVKGFVWALKLLSHFSGLVNKAFGNLCYQKELSSYREDYCLYSLRDSIERTEKKIIT